MPGIFLVGFIPMLLVALGYRELNNAMPDSGTSFTWATRAFGPWIGWMGGWGLIVATVVVLSNLAGVAVDFLYLALAQLFNNPALADLTNNVGVNVVTCLVFMTLACYVSYRGMEATKAVQYVLVAFQLIVLVWFSVAALVEYGNGSAFDALAFNPNWFNPLLVPDFSAFAAGVSLSIFIFWGWDVTLTMNEETKNPKTTPGRAATLTVAIIFALYVLVAISALMFSGVGTGEFGLGNEEIQGNVMAAIVAWGFYAVLRVVSTDVLTDTILTLGMMICFYYGVTAFACVWYFRAEAFASVRSFLFTFLAPLVGGVILSVIFVTTLIDSTNPDYGSGSNIGGLGLVFVLSMVLFIAGIVLMLLQRRANPAFFEGKTLTKGISTDR